MKLQRHGVRPLLYRGDDLQSGQKIFRKQHAFFEMFSGSNITFHPTAGYSPYREQLEQSCFAIKYSRSPWLPSASLLRVLQLQDWKFGVVAYAPMASMESSRHCLPHTPWPRQNVQHSSQSSALPRR